MKLHKIDTGMGYFMFSEAKNEYDALCNVMNLLVSKQINKALLVSENSSLSYNLRSKND